MMIFFFDSCATKVSFLSSSVVPAAKVKKDGKKTMSSALNWQIWLNQPDCNHRRILMLFGWKPMIIELKT